MVFTQLEFILFFAAFIPVYFLVPKKMQWILLLFANIIFYLSFGIKMSVFILFSSITVFFSAFYVQKQTDKLNNWLSIHKITKSKEIIKNAKKAFQGKQKIFMSIALIANLGILAFLKYYGFFAENLKAITSVQLPIFSIALPLGISFYTFTMIGYLIDVYRGVIKCERNYLKFLLFGSFFPIVVQGPICKTSDVLPQLLASHSFDYNEAAFGAQRMLWGFFKKLVIADRLAIFIGTIYNNPLDYAGVYVLMATVLFAVQIYADFSGCMDIVIGASQILGIKINENFNTPYFSRSIAEFWRRWHITLGVWFKNYMFYPMQKSALFQNTSKLLAKKLTKKQANTVISYIAMLFLWFTLGLWHGASWNFVIATGLLHWAYMTLGEIFTPLFNKTKSILHIKPENKFLGVFSTIRTFLLVCIGYVFFRANNITDALNAFAQIFANFNIASLWSGSFDQLGLSLANWIVAAASCSVLWIFDVISQKHNIRLIISQRPLAIRWFAYILLLVTVLIFGIYGPAYDPTPFIYERF